MSHDPWHALSRIVDLLHMGARAEKSAFRENWMTEAAWDSDAERKTRYKLEGVDENDQPTNFYFWHEWEGDPGRSGCKVGLEMGKDVFPFLTEDDNGDDDHCTFTEEDGFATNTKAEIVEHYMRIPDMDYTYLKVEKLPNQYGKQYKVTLTSDIAKGIHWARDMTLYEEYKGKQRTVTFYFGVLRKSNEASPQFHRANEIQTNFMERFKQFCDHKWASYKLGRELTFAEIQPDSGLRYFMEYFETGNKCTMMLRIRKYAGYGIINFDKFRTLISIQIRNVTSLNAKTYKYRLWMARTPYDLHRGEMEFNYKPEDKQQTFDLTFAQVRGSSPSRCGPRKVLTASSF